MNRNALGINLETMLDGTVCASFTVAHIAPTGTSSFHSLSTLAGAVATVWKDEQFTSKKDRKRLRQIIRGQLHERVLDKYPHAICTDGHTYFRRTEGVGLVGSGLIITRLVCPCGKATFEVKTAGQQP